MYRIYIDKGEGLEKTPILVECDDMQEAIDTYRRYAKITPSSGVQALSIDSLFEDFLKAFEEFHRLQDKYSNVGASDSEPDYKFEKQLKHMVLGVEYEAYDEYDWELFTTMRESREVAKELSEQVLKIYKIYKQMNKEQKGKTVNFLKHNCGRIEII